MVETSGGLLLAFSVGAAIGPLAASLFMEGGHPGGLFIFIGGVLFSLGIFVIYRLIIDPSGHRIEKSDFIPTSAASASVFPKEIE